MQLTVQHALLLLPLVFTYLVESAKILAIFPFVSPSQYIVAEPYLKALAARGHEMTVMSHFPQKQKTPNFRDIKLVYKSSYDDFINDLIRLGDSPEANDIIFEYGKNVSIFALENTEFQALLSSKNEHFDLVIAEALLIEVLYATATHFKAALIGFSSFGTDPTIDSFVGNPSPISYVPLVTSPFTDRMDFWQRLENFKLIATEWKYIEFQHMPEQEKLYKKYFPHLKEELRDICKNFSIILLNQHFSLSFPRPYVPGMIEVGGLHINHKPSPLPRDIAEFIDGAKNGVIYFSMGSNVKSKDFPEEKIQIILKVFGNLKQRVIWKFELTELPGKPDNVFIRKWLPQRDILAHPNVRLFITHAGLLSTTEAIFYAKAIVGMPVFYDQFLNFELAKKAGYAVGVNYRTFNETELMEAIQEVLGNPIYQKNVEEISRRYHDQPIKPLDRAIFWTEYVLRHKGAPHIRVSAVDLSLIEYHNMDLWAYLFMVWMVLPLLGLGIGFKVLKFTLRELLNKYARNKSKEE